VSQKTKRLVKVIEARERVRDRHAADTASAERVLETAKSAQADLQQRESAFLDSIAEITSAPINANVLMDLDRQRRMWAQCVDAAAHTVAQQAAEAERHRGRLREAAKSLRVSERVHEKITTVERKKHDQREQRVADDLTSARRPR
jgi:flagellar export protein FliJ